MKKDELLNIINGILENKGEKKIQVLDDAIDLRKDLNFTSLDLAELTVKIEDITGIDIFEDGLVSTVKEINEKLL
jgi:acyl carrier protein